MNLFFTLISKDLRRILRNPLPLIILLAIPLAITTVIGMAFGGGGEKDAQIAPIRLGVIDGDNSLFSRFLRGASGQDQMDERIKVTFLDSETEALKQIQDGKLSAVLVIPEGFSSAFVRGDNGLKLELIKNPSEYIYPTLAQEGAEVIVTALNALVRNFQKDLQELNGIFSEDRDFDFFRDILAVSTLIERARNRLDAAEVYLNPPLISYERESEDSEEGKADTETVSEGVKKKSGNGFNTFAYILIGMTAMFTMMIGDNCMRDLYREYRFRTFDRYRTLNEGLMPFIAVKTFYAVIVLLIAATILLGGGSLVFHFQWQHLLPMIVFVVCYSLFASGMMGLIAAIAGKERRADMFNTMIVIMLSAMGGAMWPVESLPPFIQHSIAPLSPIYWFTDTMRKLQMSPDSAQWVRFSVQFVVLGVACIAGSSLIFRFRLERGIKE